MSPHANTVSSAASPQIRAVVQQMLAATPCSGARLPLGNIKNASGALSAQRLTGSKPWYGAYLMSQRPAARAPLQPPLANAATVRTGAGPASAEAGRPGPTPGQTQTQTPKIVGALYRLHVTPAWRTPVPRAFAAFSLRDQPTATATAHAPAQQTTATSRSTSAGAAGMRTATAVLAPCMPPLKSPALVASVSKVLPGPAAGTAATGSAPRHGFAARWAALNTPTAWRPFAQQAVARPLWSPLGLPTVARIADRAATHAPAPAGPPHGPPPPVPGSTPGVTAAMSTAALPDPRPHGALLPANSAVPPATAMAAARRAFLASLIG